jgi:hypothetical protein
VIVAQSVVVHGYLMESILWLDALVVFGCCVCRFCWHGCVGFGAGALCWAWTKEKEKFKDAEVCLCSICHLYGYLDIFDNNGSISHISPQHIYIRRP